MKKNYLLLLLGLLLSTPLVHSSDDSDSDSESEEISERPNSEIISQEHLRFLTMLLKAGSVSFINLSKVFRGIAQKIEEISPNRLQSRPSTTDNSDNTSSPIQGPFINALEWLSKIENKTSLIADMHAKKLRTLDYIYKFMLPQPVQKILATHYELFKKQCSTTFPFLTNGTEDFNDPYNEENLSFESPYLTLNKILQQIIHENTEKIIPKTGLTFINAITQSTNNNIKGVIFNGVPGTGKTETARALAKKLGVPFVFNKVSDIFATSFVGKGSQKVKDFFIEARTMAKKSKSKNPIKVIMLLDEIENLLLKRTDDPESLSSHNGPIMRDHNATTVSFMDEFNACQLNEGILIIGTTNLKNKQFIDPAILSRLNYGMITFEKPSIAERADYIHFYVQKTIALKLKNNIWKKLNIPTLTMDQYMAIAEKIIKNWYYIQTTSIDLKSLDKSLDDIDCPLITLARQTNDCDLREITQQINSVFINQSKRLDQLETDYNARQTANNRTTCWANEMIQSDTPHQALETFKRWPFDEQCKKQMILKVLSKLHLTKKALPWVTFCTTLGISTALIPFVIKATPAILEFAHKKIPLKSKYALTKEYQEKCILGLALCGAAYSILKLTTKAHALSQPIINTEELINFYSNQEFKLTETDINCNYSNRALSTKYC